MAYPEKITKRLDRLTRKRAIKGGNAVGTEANFGCGSFVRFTLRIDAVANTVNEVTFCSNGCGYMLAAAEVLAKSIAKKHLTGLHGLAAGVLRDIIQEGLGEIPPDRRDCVDTCINAIRSAFADFRYRQIEEFCGEKPLICTCFGVTEETIESLIASRSLTTVDQVSQACSAGTGCGSCRMLIQELIDIASD